jgi:hypothetical protein
MPTPPLNQSAHERYVANMLASLRIEKLKPSASIICTSIDAHYLVT